MRKLFVLCILVCAVLGLEAQEKKIVNIYFENDEYILDTEDSLIIKNINIFTTRYHVLRIYVIGYCDDNGTVASNAILSDHRARVIAERIDSAHLIIKKEGRGSIAIEPNSPLNIDTQRFYNRRTEVSIIYEGKREMSKENAFDEDLQVGEKLKLENLNFYGSRHFILPKSIAALENLANQLSMYPRYEIEIQGHVCCTDDKDGFDLDTRTQDLSVQRAKAIYDYLIERGIAADRLSYKGFGSSQRSAPVNPEDRRVEIEIVNIRD